MPYNPKIVCPIIMAGENWQHCIEEECAMWNDTVKACALRNDIAILHEAQQEKHSVIQVNQGDWKL